MDGWLDGWMADCWYLPSCYNDLKYANLTNIPNIVNRRRSSTITHVCLRYACLICQPPLLLQCICGSIISSLSVVIVCHFLRCLIKHLVIAKKILHEFYLYKLEFPHSKLNLLRFRLWLFATTAAADMLYVDPNILLPRIYIYILNF